VQLVFEFSQTQKPPMHTPGPSTESMHAAVAVALVHCAPPKQSTFQHPPSTSAKPAHGAAPPALVEAPELEESPADPPEPPMLGIMSPQAESVMRATDAATAESDRTKRMTLA
jgi:hypothetical protein